MSARLSNFDWAAEFTQTNPSKSKQIQATPNKAKQNSLVLFGFIRPNRDFSMSYSESK
jgi:hypothetical protein